MIPERLGKYEIRRELGQGAMGVVYEGYDPMIQRVVALKTIRADQLQGDAAAEIIARFRREAQAAGRLSHPNVVAIHEFGEDAGTWFIAMEFVAGRSLKDCFDAGQRFRPREVLSIMAQILAALGYSHRQGVVHRDIKPANVILLPDGAVKVADFGIAHVEASELTQVGTVLGTPSYMAPEQILGLPVDGRADLFSAGVVLYQFLTGDRPFSGTATTTVQKVLKEEPLPPSALNPQVTEAFDAVIRRALAKRPEDRYPTAEAFAGALAAAGASDAAAGTDVTRIDVAAAASAGAEGGVPPKRRATAGIAVAEGVVAIGLVAAAWFAVHRAPDAAAPAAVSAKAQTTAPVAVAGGSAAPPAATAAAPAPAAAEPGTVTVAAVGLIDPNDARFHGDDAQRQAGLRAASNRQVVLKALGLMVDDKSLARNYDAVSDRLLANSDRFITRVVAQGTPQLGKDGLMSITTEAVVNVKALQKSLNQMSRDERIEFIRAQGDPKVSVRILVRAADAPDAPPRASPVAENVIKEHIRSFGFRTWSEDGAPTDAGRKGADFAVQGEVMFRRLSTRLEASGLVITKFALTSWTIKCIDRETGEEIYFDTTLPKAAGSWASEEEALKAVGGRIADAFSREFFLRHLVVAGLPVRVTIDGLPDAATEALLRREIIGLPAVIALAPRWPEAGKAVDLTLAGSGPAGERVASGVLKPLNDKLGQACFALGAVTGGDVAVTFAGACDVPAVRERFETYPPASLYAAPPSRQRAVTTNPELLRKLTI